MCDYFSRITANHKIIYPRYDPDKFVGRQWLVDIVSQFRDDHDSRHLIIAGEPGAGKSTFLAYLAETWNCPRHFIRSDNIGGVTGVDPRAFLLSIGTQLFQKYGAEIFRMGDKQRTQVTVGLSKDQAEVVGRLIDELHTPLDFLGQEKEVEVKVGIAAGKSKVIGERVKKLVNNALSLPETTLLHIAVLQPLEKLSQLHPDERAVICVDALDEALHHPGVSILDVIPRVGDDLPSNLRLVMTSRPGGHLVSFREKDLLRLDNKDAGYWQETLKDARAYIEKRFEEKPIATVLGSMSKQKADVYIKNIEKISEGNFLYLYHFLNALSDAVKQGEMDLNKITVPNDLDEIYRFFAIERIRENPFDTIEFSVEAINPTELKSKLQEIESIEGVDIKDNRVTMTMQSADETIVQIFRLAENVGFKITELKTRRGTDWGVWEEKILPVLGVLAAAFEAINRYQLAGFAGVEVTYVDSIIVRLRQFLDVTNLGDENRYRLYHTSFSEYLVDSNRNRDYPLDGPFYHQNIAIYYLDRGQQGWGKLPDDGYLFRHLANHLVASGQLTSLRALLMTPSWLKRRISNGHLNALIADYELFPQDTALIQIVEALQLSAYVLLQDVEQLASQLLARLQEALETDLLAFKASLTEDQQPPWLRPLSTSMTRPGGALIRTLQTGSSANHLLATTLNFKHALITSYAGNPIGTYAERIQVLELDSGQVLYDFDYHTDRIFALCLDRQDQWLYSSGSDKRLHIYDFNAREELFEYPMPMQSWVYDIHQLEAQDLLLLVKYDTLVVFNWRIGSIQSNMTLPDEFTRISKCLVLPNEELVAVGTWTGSLQLFEIGSWRCRWRRDGFNKFGMVLAVDPSGNFLYVNTPDRQIAALELHTGKTSRLIPGRNYPITAMSITPDGSTLVIGMNDGMVEVRYPDEPGRVYSQKEHENRVTQVRISPDSKWALTYSKDNTLKIWDLQKFSQERVLRPHNNHVSQVTPLENCNGFISVSGDKSLLVWDLETNQVQQKIESDEWIHAVVVLKSQGEIVTVESGGKLNWWNLSNGANLAQQSERVTTYHAGALSGDDRFLAVSWYIDDIQDHLYGLSIWDMKKRERIGSHLDKSGTHTPLHGQNLDMNSVINLGLSIHAYSNGVSFWKIENNAPTLIEAITNRKVQAARFAPGKPQAAIVFSDGLLEFWDIFPAFRPQYSTPLDIPVNCIAFSPDNDFLAIGGNAQLHVMELGTLAFISRFDLENDITTITFANGHQNLVVGDSNGGVHIFQLEFDTSNN
jgi:WD40 repeat protein